MKFFLRWAIRLFIVFAVLLVGLVLLKDTLLKRLTEYRLRSQTGLEVRIGRFEARLSGPSLVVQDFKVYNSAEFGGSALVDIPELRVECNTAQLALGKLHLTLLRLHLNEVNIVQSKDGRTNLVVLKERLQRKRGGQSSDKNRGMGLAFQGIDTLNLTVGKVKYSSLRKPSSNLEFDVGLKNELLTNVKSMEDLSGLLLKVIFRHGLNILSGAGDSPFGQTHQPSRLVATNLANSPGSSVRVLRKYSGTNTPARN
jgi:hypothetical protein